MEVPESESESDAKPLVFERGAAAGKATAPAGKAASGKRKQAEPEEAAEVAAPDESSAAEGASSSQRGRGRPRKS